MKLFRFRSVFTITLIVFSLLFISSCKSKKIISSEGTLEKKTHKEILTDVLKSEYKFETLTTKGNIELKAGNSSQKVPAVIKMIKDSIVQASLRIPIIGGEAMRVTFTRDSIIIIDRLKKQYVAERFKDSKTIADFDFNFYNLQAILTNSLFIPGHINVTSKDFDKFNVSVTKEVYMLQTKGKGNLLYNFAVDASDRIASTLIYNEKKDITLQWSYSDFIKDNDQIYPTNMEAKVNISKKRVDIILSYDKLEINKSLSVDNSIPSKYAKVDFTKMMGSYIKLK